MKRIVFLLTIFLLGSNMAFAQQEKGTEQISKEAQKEAKKAEKEAKKAEKKAKKEAEKAQKEARQNAFFEVAQQAIQNRSFLLKATRVEFKRGQNTHVNSDTNFVSLNGDDAVIQLAFNTAMSGPNGIGGVTVEGKASDIEITTDKKGNISFEMNVMGSGVSARLSFKMTKGTNQCTATVLPNFSSNRITFDGELFPYNSARVFKGSSL